VEQEGLSGASTSNFEDEVLDEDVGAAYGAVRARVQGIRIPSDLSLPESAKTGIRRADQPLLNVLQRSSKYCETALRVLKGSTSANREQTMSNLLKVLIAHVKFLQEEHAGLVVQSSFDPTVARFFRTLQRGGGMSPMALENLRSAASIAAVYRPQAPQCGGRGGGFG
jgi:hypothetical protein